MIQSIPPTQTCLPWYPPFPYDWEEARLREIEEEMRQLMREKDAIWARRRSRWNLPLCPPYQPFPAYPPIVVTQPVFPPTTTIGDILKKIPSKK